MGSYQEALTWIVTAINNDATLNGMNNHKAFVFSAPEKTLYPFVIINKQAGAHRLNMCGKVYDAHYLAIKCVDKSFDGGKLARNIMARVETVIAFQDGISLPGGAKILSITPNSSFEYDEQESGNNNFYHSVIVFRVVVG